MTTTSTELDRPAVAKQSAAADVVDGGFALARFGQEASLAAARDFVDQVDRLLPLQGGDDSLRRSLIDGAFSLADRVAEAQLSAARSVLHRPSIPVANVALKVLSFQDINVNVGVNVPTDVAAIRLN